MSFGNHSRQASHPTILTTDKQVFLAWKEFNGDHSHLLLIEKDIVDNKWSQPRLVDTVDGATDYPFLLADGKHVYVSWHTFSGGYRLFDISDPPAQPQEGLADTTSQGKP